MFHLAIGGTHLFAQKRNCHLVPNVASIELKELVSETLRHDFGELKRKLESKWSRDKTYENDLISALRDLESYKSFSMGLVEHEMCTEGTSVAVGYYANKLTNGVDRIRLEMNDPSAANRITQIDVTRAFRFMDIPAHKLSVGRRLQMLDAYLHDLTKANVFAGTVLVAHQGKTIYLKAFGKRYSGINENLNLEDPFDPVAFSKAFGEANSLTMKPISVNDLFNLASLNKIVTAVAVFQLIENGKLNLEDSMAKLLPDEVKSKEAGEIQLRNLLSHTSGIRFNLDQLSFKPGSKFSYNNMNFAYLGEIIERTSGMRYEDYVRIHIFAPMGMASTARFGLKRMTDSIVIGDYEDIRDGQYVLTPNPYLQKYPGSAMGGFYSTAGDLLKFAEGLRSGRLLRPETVKLMRTPRTDLNAPEYGYGVMLWKGPGIWGHSGRLPGADADLEIFAETGYVAIVLSNKSEANPPVLSKIRSLFFPQSLNTK